MSDARGQTSQSNPESCALGRGTTFLLRGGRLSRDTREEQCCLRDVVFLSPDVGFAGLDLGSVLAFEPGLIAQHFVRLFWGSLLMEKS